MKRWICWLLALLLLCGCGGEVPVQENQPWSLSVEYGESGLELEPAAWDWTWQTGASETEPPVFEHELSYAPYLNTGRETEVKLSFPVEPAWIRVSCYSENDGYNTAHEVELDGDRMPVPEDGARCLYEVIASWPEEKNAKCWGRGIYYFRMLPPGDQGDDMELPLYSLLQLKPAELFGIEMVDQQAGARKLCRDQADVETALRFLQNNLATDFVRTPIPETASDYVLQLLVTDGTRLTIGYVEDQGKAWLLLGGVPYEARPMDLNSLWQSLQTEAEYDEQTPTGEYLRVEEQYPEQEWPEEFVYGYLRSVDGQVVFDEMIWISDAAEPNGYRLEPGEEGMTVPVSPSCSYWILLRHRAPCAEVTREELLQWSADTDLLCRFYRSDGEIQVICEQYVP